MQTYDVERRDMYLIKSQNGVRWNVVLLPGESVAGLGGVQVIPTGHQVIITSAEPGGRPWGYRIDYDVDGRVIYPVMPEEIEHLIRDLIQIGCYEYTPDLLRAIKDNNTLLDEYRVKTDGKLAKIIKKLRL